MKNAINSNTKDNVATALVLAAVLVAILTAVLNPQPAHADAPMPVVQMDTIVVTAQRDHIVKLDTIVVTASRNTSF
jgi:hypothetical protein